MQAHEVEYLQIESTTRCNAWCSACTRSIMGSRLKPWITLQDMDPAVLDQSIAMFPNLQTLDFCGNLGDAIAAVNVMDHLSVALQHANKRDILISVTTNGSLRTPEWWGELARFLQGSRHEVVWSIDGLADTNHIYRQGTDFDRIMANAQAFIDTGGVAVWKFIPFQHNEHQITQALAQSQRMGFRDFRLHRQAIVPPRAWDRQSRTWFEIRPWSQQEKFRPLNQPEPRRRDRVRRQDCIHLEWRSVYLAVDGGFHSCCHLTVFTDPMDFEQLPDIQHELATKPSRYCLIKCGTCASIG